MIKRICEDHIPECVCVIKSSFVTVADALGFTPDNAPRFTAFATTEDRLKYQMFVGKKPMFAYFDGDVIAGYYSLTLNDKGECELNNLCVLPGYRHKGIGSALLDHAFQTAKDLQCIKMNIGIVEENTVLKAWYESFGFIHRGTKKFDHFPFTCGYLDKML